MSYLISDKFKSIKVINYLLFLTLLYANLFSYTYDINLEYDLIFFSVNLILLIMFFVVNKKYETEFVERKNDMEILSLTGLSGKDEEIKALLGKKTNYKENADTYKLFKNMYIRKNLASKDYHDLREVFNKFIPEAFLVEVGKAGTDRIPLGIGVKKHLNVIFLDMIGFTTISEELPPDRALLLLNAYFDGIVEIIRTNGGYIDKFLGDGIMAIFNREEADTAVRTAIEIQNFVKKFQISEIGKQISVGIGINTGEVILGTIGSNRRMEITIIGDVVNTASRIEGLTRIMDNNIIISESCYKSIKNVKELVIVDLGEKKLRGKKKVIKIYGVEPIQNINLKKELIRK